MFLYVGIKNNFFNKKYFLNKKYFKNNFSYFPTYHIIYLAKLYYSFINLLYDLP